AANLVGLMGKEEGNPANLSGGEGQRVALARSLVLQPDVLLLDEPLAALDPKLRKQMRIKLTAMQRRVGITFLLVTHDQEEALSMSNQLAVMNPGRIEHVRRPEEMYLRPQTRFVAGFLRGVNWIGDVGIRPEVARIVQSAEDRCERTAVATVIESVFLGYRFQVLVKLANGQQAIAQVNRGSTAFQPGQTVEICWDTADEMKLP